MNQDIQSGLKKWFEENYLDGDKIQGGQMLSSETCFEAITLSVEAKEKEIRELLKTRKPGHGSCCTCQGCGFYHDDCECSGNGERVTKYLIPNKKDWGQLSTLSPKKEEE